MLLGGKFASEIFKLVLKRYAIKTHVKHTHRAYTRGKEEERDLESAFFLFTLSRSLSVVLCGDLSVGESVRNFKFRERDTLFTRSHTRDILDKTRTFCARERIRESESLRSSFLLESVASQLV